MLDRFQLISNKEPFISFVYVLTRYGIFDASKNKRSKVLIYNKLIEVSNKILLSEAEKSEVSINLEWIRKNAKK